MPPELLRKQGVNISVGERVYIGKDLNLRQEILHVKKRVGFSELTHASQSELSGVVMTVIRAHEARFVQFFNEAQAITTRFHMLELLPGLGKKTMWGIIEERKKGPFKELVEITQRVPMAHQVDKLLAKRIEAELSHPDEKYH